MSNRIIDVFTAMQAFETDETNTERLVITSAPTRVGSLARISFYMEGTVIDAAMAIRRGAGLSGDVIWSKTETGAPTVIIVDTSPVSQYTLTNADDTVTSIQVTFSVEQIS